MFTGGTRAIVKTLEKNEYVEIGEKKVERDPLANKQIDKTENLQLTGFVKESEMQECTTGVSEQATQMVASSSSISPSNQGMISSSIHLVELPRGQLSMLDLI